MPQRIETIIKAKGGHTKYLTFLLTKDIILFFAIKQDNKNNP